MQNVSDPCSSATDGILKVRPGCQHICQVMGLMLALLNQKYPADWGMECGSHRVTIIANNLGEAHLDPRGHHPSLSSLLHLLTLPLDSLAFQKTEEITLA